MTRQFFTANNFGHLSVFGSREAAQEVVDKDPNCFTLVMAKTEAIKKYGKKEVEFAISKK